MKSRTSTQTGMMEEYDDVIKTDWFYGFPGLKIKKAKERKANRIDRKW